MDPVSIVGLAGSIVNIVDIIAKSIKNLRELQQKWKAADLIVNSLIGQLFTLKSALTKIEEWMSSSLSKEPQHEQLAVDLKQSLECCHFLVTFMYDHLLLLDWNEANRLTSSSKIRAVFHDSEVKDCATYLDRQTNALNLLLTALNCQSLSQQQSLLHASETRKILDHVKDDSSSLVGLRARSSFRSSRTASSCTESSVLLSLTFDFDDEILDTNLYQRQLKSQFRQEVCRAFGRIPSPQEPTVSRGHDFLVRHSERLRRSHFSHWSSENNLLPLVSVPVFDDGNDLSTIMTQLKDFSSTRNNQLVRSRFKHIIHLYAIIIFQYLLEVIRVIRSTLYIVHLSPEFETCAGIILSLNPDLSYDAGRIVISRDYSMLSNANIDVARSIRVLRNGVQDNRRLSGTISALLPQWYRYFYDSVDRITETIYEPSNADVKIAVENYPNLGKDEIIHEGRFIRFVRSDEVQNAYVSSPIVLFLITLSCRSQPQQIPGCFHSDSIQQPDPHKCATSEIHEGYSPEDTSIYHDFIIRREPENIAIIYNTVNTSKVAFDCSLPHSGRTGNCAQCKISRIRHVTQGRKVHIHYTPSVEQDLLYTNGVPDYIAFILDTVEGAFDQKSRNYPETVENSRAWTSEAIFTLPKPHSSVKHGRSSSMEHFTSQPSNIDTHHKRSASAATPLESHTTKSPDNAAFQIASSLAQNYARPLELRPSLDPGRRYSRIFQNPVEVLPIAERDRSKLENNVF